MSWMGWEQAWHEALYGPGGFYRAPAGPSGHFTTATHGPTGAVLADALVRLARDNRLTHVVDVGAGRGELLRRLHAAEPALRLTGLDVVARPAELPQAVAWLRSEGGSSLPSELTNLSGVLVVAHEWLDVVPCTLAEVDDDGVLRHLLVDVDNGGEALGDPVLGEELDWAARHWPSETPGERVEIGLARDRAWAGLVARVTSGLLLAVDYGHRAGERPGSGTLTAYDRGRQREPLPDGSCDLTAHVAMDTLDQDELLDQRTALVRLGVQADTPDHALARTDPAAYLHGLERASAAAALTARGGFGDFLWAFKRVG